MTTAELKRAKIAEFAAKYRAQGYDVKVQPGPDELPPFLSQFAPALIATSSAGNVVIEVKSAPEFDAADARQLMDALEGQQNWRAELVFVSQPVAPDVPAQEMLVDDAQVTRMLVDAETLAREGHLDAAGLIAWSAVEAILRRHAQTAAPDMERQSSARVLKHLYGLGEVQPEIYEKLLLLLEFRNALAHGFQPRHGTPSIPDIIRDIRRLKDAA
jgi:hypothetical protein